LGTVVLKITCELVFMIVGKKKEVKWFWMMIKMKTKCSIMQMLSC